MTKGHYATIQITVFTFSQRTRPILCCLCGSASVYAYAKCSKILNLLLNPDFSFQQLTFTPCSTYPVYCTQVYRCRCEDTSNKSNLLIALLAPAFLTNVVIIYSLRFLLQGVAEVEIAIWLLRHPSLRAILACVYVILKSKCFIKVS